MCHSPFWLFSATADHPIPRSSMTPEEMQSFRECLANSKRVIVLCGAGLSAASGLGTFRGAGGWWRKHEATKLATPQAFSRDPSLVWQFYAYRRHKARLAKPNSAHLALAEYTRQNPEKIFTITQNVDGLSSRAGHLETNLVAMHGDLWSLKCEKYNCDFVEKNLKDPIVPALAVSDKEFPDDEAVPTIPNGELPHCPKCNGLLRPAVVFFNEQLPESATDTVQEWLFDNHVDLMLVIGTSGVVYPAAGYSWSVKMRGGKVAVFNIERDSGAERLEDWMFEGPCEELLPEALGINIAKLK